MAKQKLDMFERHAGDENFINYDMLDSGSNDVCTTGESVMAELEKHKDVSFTKVKDQVGMLAVKFDKKVPEILGKAVECQRVEGVVIDEQELHSLGDMIKEASHEQFKK